MGHRPGAPLMPDFRLQDGMDYEEAGIAGHTLTTVANDVDNVKGSWVQLVAATARPATGVFIWSHGDDATNWQSTDIGVGDAASEVVLIPDLPLVSPHAVGHFFPISIPAWSRIAARTQGAAGGNAYVGAMLISEGFASPSAFGRVTAYGVVTGGTTSATALAYGTAGAKGAWTQLVASTSHPCSSVVVTLGSLSSLYSYDAAVDVAVGAAGSEVIVVSDLQCNVPGGGYSGMATFNLPLTIPAGSRISARVASNGDSYNSVYAAVHGID